MTKTNRANFLYQFQGRILTRRPAKASPNSKYAHQSYYVLTLLQADQTKKSIQVFRSKLASPQIWTTLEKSQCFGKQYHLFCKNQRGYYYLVDWQELKEMNHYESSK